MLDPRWIIALVLLDVWGFWAQHDLLALACTSALLFVAAAGFYRRHDLRGVSYQRVLGRERAHQGEVVSLDITFVNNSVLPLTLLEIYDTMPRHVTLTGGALRNNEAGLSCLYIARTMSPFTRVSRHLEVRCARRGVHQFGPVRYQGGDIVGLTQQHGGDNVVQQLLVLPKIFALDLAAISARQINGAHRAPIHMLADPQRRVGTREYRPGDPRRSVDWRATARRSTLMVREVEPTASRALQIVLNFKIRWPAEDRVEPDELEFAISVAASAADYACRRGVAVGLTGNGTWAGKPISLPASRAPQQVARILELLAHASSRPSGTLAALLRQRERSILGASEWLIITDHLSSEEEELLRAAERRGHAVLVLLTCTADKVASLHPSLRRLHVPYREGWSLHDALSFAA